MLFFKGPGINSLAHWSMVLSSLKTLNLEHFCHIARSMKLLMLGPNILSHMLFCNFVIVKICVPVFVFA